MSLALVQEYSSEEEAPDRFVDSDSASESSADEEPAVPSNRTLPQEPHHHHHHHDGPLPDATVSDLPSASSIFSEVTGPPAYLKDSVIDLTPSRSLSRPRPQKQFGKNRLQQDVQNKKEPPAGAVVQAKPQLVAVHERVRSDNAIDEIPKLPMAGMPPAEDAARLLGVCLQCGVPKTYSAVKEGMVCPVCKDRPLADDGAKKRGSKIKEKERSKRMKGQSTHATWKSETEMQLRQQFD